VAPQLPRLHWPSTSGECAGGQGQPVKQHEDTGLPEPSCASSCGDNGSTSDADGSQLVQPDSHRLGSDLMQVDQSPDLGGCEALTCAGDAEAPSASQKRQLVDVQREPQEAPTSAPTVSTPERASRAAAAPATAAVAAATADEHQHQQGGSPLLDAVSPEHQAGPQKQVPPPPPPPQRHETPTSGTTEEGDFGTPRSEQRERRPQSDEGSDLSPPPTVCRGGIAEDCQATEAEVADSSSSGEDDALLTGEQISVDDKDGGTAGLLGADVEEIR